MIRRNQKATRCLVCQHIESEVRIGPSVGLTVQIKIGSGPHTDDTVEMLHKIFWTSLNILGAFIWSIFRALTKLINVGMVLRLS